MIIFNGMKVSKISKLAKLLVAKYGEYAGVHSFEYLGIEESLLTVGEHNRLKEKINENIDRVYKFLGISDSTTY